MLKRVFAIVVIVLGHNPVLYQRYALHAHRAIVAAPLQQCTAHCPVELKECMNYANRIVELWDEDHFI